MIKRGHAGTYHKMSPKHMSRYVSEFAGRHNVRGADTIEQMGAAFTHMVGKHLAYSSLIPTTGGRAGRGLVRTYTSSSPWLP